MTYTNSQLYAILAQHKRAAEEARSPAMSAVLRHAEIWQEGFDLVAGLAPSDEAARAADVYAADAIGL